MRIFLYGLFLSCLISFIPGCNQTPKPFLLNLEECSIETKDSSFDNKLYPFIESEYKTSEMMKYFKKGVKIDSILSKQYNGDTVVFYKYYDESSHFIFSLYNYSNGKYNYEIASFQISSNILKFKNNIECGMTRKELFNAINFKKVSCDTVSIHYGFRGYYFVFIFQDNKLKQMSKEYIQ